MRISDKMTFDSAKVGMMKNRADLAELQNQAATQKRLNRPSDDPLATSRVLAGRTDVKSHQQFTKNVGFARSLLEYTDQSLLEGWDILVRAKEIALSQSNDASSNKTSRQISGSEIRQLYNQMIQVGNRKFGDRFVFGGFSTGVAPFTKEGVYRGDGGEIQIAFEKEGSVVVNVPGSWAFLGQRPSDPDPMEIDPETGKLEKPPTSEVPSEPDDELRGPASAKPETEELAYRLKGLPRVNVLKALEDLAIALDTGSREGVQDSLDVLDESMSQIVMVRADVGSRLNQLDKATENLSKAVVDGRAVVSGLEDADTFELVADLGRTENTLKASLSTSSRLIQPSLLDFLR